MPYFFTGGEAMLGKGRRAQRQLAALASLATIPGELYQAKRARDADASATALEEAELAKRLHTQTVDAQQSATSPAERRASTAAPETPAASGESPQEHRGRLAALAGSMGGRFLRRLVGGDPLQGQRLRHIAEMKGELGREEDIGKRLHAVSPFARYTEDPGGLVRGVGGEELGIPTERLQPSPKTGRALEASAARAALKSALGRDPTDAELTAKLDQMDETKYRRKVGIQADERARHGDLGTETETTGGTEWVLQDAKPGEQARYDSALLQDNIAISRLQRQHRPIVKLHKKTLRRKLRPGEGGPGEDMETPAAPAPATSAPFTDAESGITFGEVGE